MANTILNARIILKHGTAEEWAASSLVLLQGELGLDTTSLILKIGDGVHTWTELSPASLSAQEAEKLIQTLGHTHSNKDILDKTDAAFTTDQKLKLAGLSNYSHPASGVTPGTYRSVTVDSLGHVSAGSNPTTLSGYGITDAASKTHTHTAADIPAVQAGAIQGKISLDNLPAAALERCVVVADDNARLKLTNAEVQNGETVKVLSSGLMYLVTDDTHLNAEAGYEVYTAGSAASVPWSGITGKPVSFAPSTHTHAMAEVSGLQASLDAKASASQGAKADSAVQTISIGGVAQTKTNGAVNLPAYPQVYVHPAHTAQKSGLYKVKIDELGHVSETAAVTKADITSLGIPGSAVTYGIATASTAGLVKSSSAQNQVSVNSAGLMTVNSLSTDRLVPGTSVLIFDCGSVV